MNLPDTAIGVHHPQALPDGLAIYPSTFLLEQLK